MPLQSPFASPHPSARRASGFTLIELLVVIAIIALLAGMMFPVLMKAREAGRRVVCISNLRQIGMGIQMYAQDHVELMPDPGPSGREWPLNIMPYVGSTQMFRCASDSHSGEPTINGAGSDALAFGWNSLDTGTGNYGFKNPAGGPISLNSVALPSETILIFDYFNGNAPNEAQVTSTTHLDTGSNATTRVSSRHNDGFNTLFADGHTRFRKYGSTRVGEWTVQAD